MCYIDLQELMKNNHMHALIVRRGEKKNDFFLFLS